MTGFRGNMATLSRWRGNKAALPSKPCVQCGRPMTWRRAWAKNWGAVKFCSERCRAQARAAR